MNDIFGIFEQSDIEAITALIDRLEESSFDYLKLQGNGINIVLGKNGFCDEAPAPAAAPAAVAAVAAPTPVIEAAPEAAATVEEAPAAAPAPAAEEAGYAYIISPSYGLFYAQSEPGAPAYVKLGDTVQPGDTVGLLEIMKTYTAITSDIAGEIVEILVNNQDPLEPDQPLFKLKLN